MSARATIPNWYLSLKFQHQFIIVSIKIVNCWSQNLRKLGLWDPIPKLWHYYLATLICKVGRSIISRSIRSIHFHEFGIWRLKRESEGEKKKNPYKQDDLSLHIS